MEHNFLGVMLWVWSELTKWNMKLILQVRVQAIRGLPLFCKDTPEYLSKIVDILVQLLAAGILLFLIIFFSVFIAPLLFNSSDIGLC